MSRFTAVDDLIHDISGDPNGRESLLWTAPLPAEGLLLFCYAWRDASTERYGRFVCVSGEDPINPLVLDFAEDLALDGENLDDCAIGGLRVRQPVPLQVAEIAFTSDAVDVRARFEGLHAPFSWHENRGGCPTWAATDRYEQSCRTEGTLRVASREIAFSSVGHRDHSWGTRDWRALQHWKWMNAATHDGEVSLHAWVSYALGDRQVLGYVNRGGEVTPLQAIEASADLDDRMIHRGIAATLTDEAGRTTAFAARTAAGWQMPIRHLYLNEMAMEATIDGRPAVAHVELGWPQAYVDDLVGAASAHA